MGRYCLEICCGTASEAAEAAANGADRIELNSALEVGGLTPSAGCAEAARSLTGAPLLAMIRPRPGDFCYDGVEWRTALADARAMLRRGADGLVFGFLRPDRTIDADRVRAMLDLAGERDCVFHRAFDFVPDWRRGLETLIALGVRRVLSSGGRSGAGEGSERLAEMARFAGEAIGILPGGGVRPENARDILRATGCRQIHLSARRPLQGSAASAGVRLGGADDGVTRSAMDPRIVAEMRAILDSMEESE